MSFNNIIPAWIIAMCLEPGQTVDEFLDEMEDFLDLTESEEEDENSVS